MCCVERERGSGERQGGGERRRGERVQTGKGAIPRGPSPAPCAMDDLS